MRFFGIKFGKPTVKGFQEAVNKELGFFTKRIEKLDNLNSEMTEVQGEKDDEISTKQNEIKILEGELHSLDMIKESNNTIIEKMKSFLDIKKD